MLGRGLPALRASELLNGSTMIWLPSSCRASRTEPFSDDELLHLRPIALRPVRVCRDAHRALDAELLELDARAGAGAAGAVHGRIADDLCSLLCIVVPALLRRAPGPPNALR